MYVIYSIKCKTTGKEYIGKTKDLEVRIKQHYKYVKLENSDRSHYPLYMDMKANGVDTYSIDVIDSSDFPIEASNLEKYYIETRNPVYNNTKGGEGTNSVDVEKIINLYSEYKNSKEISRITGYDNSTVLYYLHENNVEIDLSLVRDAARKKIESFDLNSGQTIKTYESVSEASIDVTGKTTGRSAINKVATGRIQSYHKMGWRYIT